MSFPTSPTNGQISVVNNVAYQYATANSSWTRVLSIANVIQANVVSANILSVVQAYSVTGNITTGNYFIGNGAFLTGIAAGSSYSNANVAAYLPTYTGNLVGLTGPVTTTSNVTANNVLFGTGVVSGTGTVYAATVSTTGNVNSGFLSTGPASVGNLISGGYVSATGNISAPFFIGNGSQLTGISAGGTPTSIVNGTSNVVVAASGNVTVAVAGTAAVATFTTAGLVANSVSATNNGAGTNFRVGDDTWIGDINVADTMSIRGQQSALNGYIVFGNADNTQLGRAGSGPLTYGGAFSATGNVTGGNILTAGLISATGNITGGNILGGANVNATTHTGTTVSVTANITGGNILTGGLVSATSTVTGSSLLGSVISASGNVIGNRIVVGNGTAAAPSVVFSGDTAVDTGFYWISDGNIGVSTNGTLRASFLDTGFSAVANITGGNVLTGGLISATGNITGGNVLGGANVNATTHTGTTVSVTGNIDSGNLRTAGVLLVNTGNAAQAITNGAANGVGNIGSSTTYFNTVFAKATSAQYADLAEMYVSDADYPPGTVLEFGGNHEVTISNTAASPLVAGVVSTHPAHLMNSTVQGEHVVAIALVGRVPTQVIGPISKGAMMVSAGNGYAQACAAPAMGTVIGKAVESFDGESGTIEIVVGRL